MSSAPFAIVDCGTNTFNLLIGQLEEGKWKLLFSNKIPVKIGAGGFADKLITSARMARGIDALVQYHLVCKTFGVERNFVFATSALRDAKNASVFIDKIKSLTGWKVNVISGDEEANLIFQGVRQSLHLDGLNALIMDIGGGSTEFIISQNGQDVWRKSYPLGVSRLFEQIQPKSRISQQDLQGFKSILDEQLADLKSALKEFPCDTLVGSSGSFDTLLALHQQMQKSTTPIDEERAQEIPIASLSSIYMQMMGSTLEERLKNPVIPTIRAEYMPLSCYLVKYVLDIHPFQKVLRSPFALKEGVIFSKII